jgi:hypothetical protein
MVKVAFLCFILLQVTFQAHLIRIVFYVIMFNGAGCIFVFNSVAGDKMPLNTFAGHFLEQLILLSSM